MIVIENPNYHYTNPIFNHQGNYIYTEDRTIQIRMRLQKPNVALLDNVLNFQECCYLIEQAKQRLQPSKVYENGQSIPSSGRTSSGSFFSLQEDEMISTIEKRLSEIMKWPTEKAEGLQVLNYQIGQEYKPHFDYFKSLENQSRGQRVATMVLYLNDVDTGGGTTFPKLGLTVQPKIGSALYFEYWNEQGQTDELSLHSGDPVLKGEKWIATKWTRERSF